MRRCKCLCRCGGRCDGIRRSRCRCWGHRGCNSCRRGRSLSWSVRAGCRFGNRRTMGCRCRRRSRWSNGWTSGRRPCRCRSRRCCRSTGRRAARCDRWSMSVRWRVCRRRCRTDIITDTVEAHLGATHRVCVAYPCGRVIDGSCTTVSNGGARVPAGTRVVLA